MKKLLLLLATVAVTMLASAQSYIVYSKGDYSLVTATVPAVGPPDAPRASFLATVQNALGKPTPYETQMTLGAPPAPEWGKVIEGARGRFEFRDRFKGGWLGHIQLEGLTPGHTYRLCLNGHPKLAGNDRLPEPVKGLPEEHYFDFFTVTADARGRYDATFAVGLPAGAYDVRLSVKDTADHTIFLYHDFFRFTVE